MKWTMSINIVRILVYSVLAICMAVLLTFLVNPLLFAPLFHETSTALSRVAPPKPVDGILAIDLDGDGLVLTELKPDTRTFFDLDNDGFAEQTAWVSAGDGILVIDHDGDGHIGDASELFGDTAQNGFEELAALDSNNDGAIDEQDQQWDQLRIWKDDNQDAHAQSKEIYPLSEWQIISISLKAEPSESIIAGNAVRWTAQVTLLNGSKREIAAISLKMNQVNTSYIGDYTLDPQALFLPTLRGFGTLKNLHVAISQDGDLLGMLRELAMRTDLSAFGDVDNFDSAIEAILFRWAGVQELDPASRGPHIDARKLAFLEKFTGRKWMHQSGASNPSELSAAKLMESWEAAFENKRAHLLFQMCGHQLFENTTYDPWKGDLAGTFALSRSGIDGLVPYAKSARPGQENYWHEVARFLKYTRKLGNLSPEETAWLAEAVAASASPSSWQQISGQ